MSAVDDVFSYVETLGLAGGSTGWGLIRRRMMDAPATDQLVVVGEDGGTTPEIADTLGIGDAALADVGVLISVRGAAWDGDGSASKAQAIFNALHSLQNTVLASGGEQYIRVRALTPEPVFAGFDDRGRPLHTIAFRLLRALTVSS